MGLPSIFDAGEVPHLTMITKKGRRMIENAAEIMSHLQKAFPRLQFQTLEGHRLAGMSIREQVLTPFDSVPTSLVPHCNFKSMP